jgi:xanthine dehydrogenase YagS FAD-binding subunit
MRSFVYTRAAAVGDALSPAATKIAGGTNLLDLMKHEVAVPTQIVDINHLPLADIRDEGEGLRIGALARNSDLAGNARVRRDYGVLSMALLSGASGQLRNKATTGGNLCQRTRCYYFTDTAMPCNKREAGSGCSAIGGLNRIHAILGANTTCIATYPGDMAVAMSALDATVEITSDSGERRVPLREFHRLDDADPARDNVLEAGDLITAVTLPAPITGRSAYRKVRDRSSYAFALVSIAAVVEMDRGSIASAALAFGGLAHKPWHDPAVAAVLVGERPSSALFDKAADILLADAKGWGGNDFKIPLARRALRAVLAELTGDGA